jgi:hypothetical protein
MTTITTDENYTTLVNLSQQIETHAGAWTAAQKLANEAEIKSLESQRNDILYGEMKPARYILIDDYSDFIYGDSARLNGEPFVGTAIEFARAMDESNGCYGRTYTGCTYTSGTDGYHVYSADENVAIVIDGQDAGTRVAVRLLCQYAGFISRTENCD